jgi:prolyl-tRNA editing enzyme YbaK/EbsC (Cys-tRNA(Pro) deacylase)
MVALGIPSSEFAVPRLVLAEAGYAVVATPIDVTDETEADVVSRVTGFPAAWAPAVSVDDRVPTWLDDSIAGVDVFYCPGGEEGLIVGIRTAELMASGAVTQTHTTRFAGTR